MKYTEMMCDESLSEVFLPNNVNGDDDNNNNNKNTSTTVTTNNNRRRNNQQQKQTSPRNNNNNTTPTLSSSSSPTTTTMSSNSHSMISLYDAESMINMKSSVAAGYIILLSGGGQISGSNSNNNNTNPFFALKKNNKKSQQEQSQLQESPLSGIGPEQSRQQQQQQATTIKSQQQQQEDEFMSLAFASLTDGNVIDACFGVCGIQSSSTSSNGVSSTKKAKNTIHERMVRDAKNAISTAASNNDTIKVQTVQSYRKAFQIIVDTRQKLKKLNICTRCIYSAKIRDDAIVALQTIFGPIERSVQDTIQ
jgi:hypothetical protein